MVSNVFKPFKFSFIPIVLVFLLSGCGSGDSIHLPNDLEDVEENTLTRIGDIPFLKDSKIDMSKSLIFGEGKSWSGQLMIKVPVKKLEVFNYYVKNLPSFDWKEQTTIRGETSVLNYLGGNNRVAIITVQEGRFGSSVVIISVSPFTEEFESALGDTIKEKFLDFDDEPG